MRERVFTQSQIRKLETNPVAPQTYATTSDQNMCILEGIDITADPRHVDMLTNDVYIHQGKAVNTPPLEGYKLEAGPDPPDDEKERSRRADDDSWNNEFSEDPLWRKGGQEGVDGNGVTCPAAG